MFLPDINVWLALVFEAHVHHPAAKAWFDSEHHGKSFFCRITQCGFLRLATNPAVFGDEAVSVSEAWRLYDLMRADPRISRQTEPAGTEHLWRARTYMSSWSPKVWTDAYLAAFAEAAGLTLVTFDSALAANEKGRAIHLP